MSVPVLTFFNHKGGVGKTSLVFHVAWMLSMLGKRVVAIDLDPQANLTSAFLSEDDLEALWEPATAGPGNATVHTAPARCRTTCRRGLPAFRAASMPRVFPSWGRSYRWARVTLS